MKDLDVNGIIILKCILMKYDTRAWTGFSWLRISKNGRFLE